MTPADGDVLELARTDRRSLIDLPRLQETIRAAGLDAVVASSSPNVTYTGGSFIDFPPLLTFVVTTADGRQGIVINEGDAAYFREYSWVEDIRAFRYATSTVASNLEAVRMTAEVLRELGATEVVGVERSHLPALYLETLQGELPGSGLLDAGDVFESVRVIKTQGEIDLLAYAARATDKAISTGFALARPGDTEQQLAALIQGAVVRLGADGLDHADVHESVPVFDRSASADRDRFLPVAKVHRSLDLSGSLQVRQVLLETTDQRDRFVRMLWVHCLTGSSQNGNMASGNRFFQGNF